MSLHAQAALATVTFLALTCLNPATAQKVEREFRLSERDVPTGVTDYLDSAFLAQRRRKFYLDVDGRDTTIEAKFKDDGAWYSVEFTAVGEWRDTEVEAAIDEVPAEVWSQVCTGWTERFDRFRVTRVQYHVGRDEARYYEVELSVRIDFAWSAYEFHLAPDGTLLKETEIKLSRGHLSRW